MTVVKWQVAPGTVLLTQQPHYQQRPETNAMGSNHASGAQVIKLGMEQRLCLVC